MLNESHRENISKALKGRRFTGEHRKRLSKALSGSKNPRFGTKHTGDLKRFGHQKRCRPVEIDGVVYPSGKAAAEALNVHPTCIVAWIKNGKAKRP